MLDCTKILQATAADPAAQQCGGLLDNTICFAGATDSVTDMRQSWLEACSSTIDVSRQTDVQSSGSASQSPSLDRASLILHFETDDIPRMGDSSSSSSSSSSVGSACWSIMQDSVAGWEGVSSFD